MWCCIIMDTTKERPVIHPNLLEKTDSKPLKKM